MQELGVFQTQDAYLREVFELVDERMKLYDKYLEIRTKQDNILDTDSEYTLLDEKNQSLFRKMTSISRRSEQAVKNGVILPLEYLFRCFHLTPFEKHCVFLSLAAELNSWYEKKYSYYQGDCEKKRPTLDFCIDSYIFGSSERNELISEIISRKENYYYFFLMSKEEEKGFISIPLYLEPRMLSFLFDYDEMDERLKSFCHLYIPNPMTTMPLVIRGELLQQMENFTHAKRENVFFYLYGQEGSGKKLLASHYCMNKKRLLLFVDMLGLEKQGIDSDLLLRIIRETRIRRSYLCFYHFDDCYSEEDSEKRKLAGKYFLKELEQYIPKNEYVVFLLGKEAWQMGTDGIAADFSEIFVELPDISERLLLWEKGLTECHTPAEVTKEALAAKFSFSPGQIVETIKEVKRLEDTEASGTISPDSFYKACRKQITKQVRNLTTPIHSKYVWDDLVLPTKQKSALKAACNQVEYQHKIYEEWGFSEKVTYGRGVSMLFYGPPGTGKTMGAQVVANELHLDIYKVEIAAVMSKYIGETEKNLNAVFEEVKRSQSILFFDEADALFGKRSEVKDSHDKYANAETAYLLQKMEEYEGIVILATNLKQNFDEAFRRRIKFMIEFPFPGTKERSSMWKNVFPKKAPLGSDIDYSYLSEQFELSGASIKNIAVAAAFFAASEKNAIHMKHILTALIEEMKKSGKNLQRDDLGEYYFLLQQLES